MLKIFSFMQKWSMVANRHTFQKSWLNCYICSPTKAHLLFNLHFFRIKCMMVHMTLCYWHAMAHKLACHGARPAECVVVFACFPWDPQHSFFPLFYLCKVQCEPLSLIIEEFLYTAQQSPSRCMVLCHVSIPS